MADLLRISILGTTPGGEEWSTNPVIRIDPPGDIVSFGDGAAVVAAINALTVPTGIRALMSSQMAVSGCRVEARFSNGTLEGVFEGVRGTPVIGSGSATHPPQCASVFSLRTQTPGPSGRGRLYWPATGALMTASNLRLDPTTATNAIAGMKTYLSSMETAIETALGAPCSLVVWSRKNGSMSAVDRIQVGDVIDTQRRRRDTLVENFSETTYP